jgi:DNA invertase Pin-like site-specific DNA recombinase
MRHIPPSIESIGLERYLNEKVESHNNFGYQDFVIMLEQKLSKSSIAKAFGVNRNTIIKWIAIYEKEQVVNETDI